MMNSAEMVVRAYEDIRYPHSTDLNDLRLPNYLNALYDIMPAQTPMLKMMAQRNRLESEAAEEFVWADLDE